MALAKDMLQREPMPLEKVAAAIGYESASAFSTAFRRRFGRPPSHLARGFVPEATATTLSSIGVSACSDAGWQRSPRSKFQFDWAGVD